MRSNEIRGASYRLRCESSMNCCVKVETRWHPFVNPFTSQIQFLNILHTTRFQLVNLLIVPTCYTNKRPLLEHIFLGKNDYRIIGIKYEVVFEKSTKSKINATDLLIPANCKMMKNWMPHKALWSNYFPEAFY